MVKVDGDRRSDSGSDSDLDEEDGARKKKERARKKKDEEDEASSPYMRQLREDYPAPILPWNWEGKVCVLFWIIIFVAGFILLWLLVIRNSFPRVADAITQCATKYEMIDGAEFTSEVNCTTVKEKTNCKGGNQDEPSSDRG